ncbi:hypothetical protein [Lactococcus garvieae]|uniref:Uncharacterized protein n=1 Tax=Lactococcus garvieae TaxID=1363 RepID=A0AA46YQW5_9LACT|nr:hypothetical protein [Lactococcus garvieae]UYT09867.1 hypothetical protein OF801_07775 [Lactococcus garvieae]UYT11840.1 hypothetical protein OF800_07435 [Lactococcus garvieae]
MTVDGSAIDEQDYDVSMLNQIDTSKLGEQELRLRVHYAPYYKDITVKANIIWGSTLVAEDQSQTKVDASVSLLHKPDEIPYLNANQGFGVLNPNMTTQPSFQILRQNDKNKLIDVTSDSFENPQDMAGRWNGMFEKVSLRYGDVAVMSVKSGDGSENLHGEDTFISRNETLVKETVGYDDAFYELTSNGYRLMHVNQFIVNKDVHVPLHTTKEEMNKDILKFINPPETVASSDKYRIEFESVDTASSGKKSSVVSVYEKLESGGEFQRNYTVDYIVDPEVTEYYYDTEANLFNKEMTSFEYGTSFTPGPRKYIDKDEILYIYKGWSEEKPDTENFVLQEGIPSSTSREKAYYYVYEKADQLINVTIPTDIVFGTYDDSKVVSSKGYDIKNNSSEVDLEIDLSKFEKIKSDVTLLNANDSDPSEKEASARLNLMVGDKTAISGLTESTNDQELTYLPSGQSSRIRISGTYFGESSEKHKVEYAMHLKFKAQGQNKK